MQSGKGMKFSQHYTVKWHDTDANREVCPSQILAYMQETSHHHLIDAGMSLDELRDRHKLAFFLSRISIAFYAPLFANEEITVQTWILESKGLSFLRCFRILRKEEVVAEAHSVWALLDLHQNRLLPVTAFPYHIEPDAPLDAKLSARLRIPPLAEMEQAGDRRIVYSDIDYNGHLNSVKYIEHMLNELPLDIFRTHTIHRVEVSYSLECFYREHLSVFMDKKPDAHEYDVEIRKPAGEVACRAKIIFGASPAPSRGGVTK